MQMAPPCAGADSMENEQQLMRKNAASVAGATRFDSKREGAAWGEAQETDAAAARTPASIAR
jgi:hypothetical protein